MTEHEVLKREGLAWLVAQVRWEHRLEELRRAATASEGPAPVVIPTREAANIAA